jgi:hypothetical protein
MPHVGVGLIGPPDVASGAAVGPSDWRTVGSSTKDGPVRGLALVLLFVVVAWVIWGAMLAFLGYMAHQGLAAGSNKKLQELRMRQERWAGRVAVIMYRRLWPIPVVALVGFVAIAVNYPV